MNSENARRGAFMQLRLDDNDLSKILDEETSSDIIQEVSSQEEPVEKYSEPWPEMNEYAFHGLVGSIVKTITPYTEADPIAVLISILTAFGNCLGATSYFQIEHKKHYLRLFSVLVGRSAIGRKGTSWATPKFMFEQIEPEWVLDRIVGGLASGEGLVNEVRDERREKKPIKEKGRITGYEEEIVDQGVIDKRLMVVEEEFAQVLKVGGREGNILSDILRKAWDDGNLRNMSKNNPLRATGAHISVIGHIGKDELLRYLNDTEQANGFGNRFLWFLVKRSKLIPNPTGTPLSSLNSLISQLEERIIAARKIGLLVRDEEAEGYWSKVYPLLTEERSGLIGSLTARAPVQVMRIAGIYALLDKSSKIRIPHLKAALAILEYVENSIIHIFGDSIGDPYADRILSELREIYPEGMTETEIWKLFGNHNGKRIHAALEILKGLNYVSFSKGISTGGKSPKVWRAAKKAKYAKKVYLKTDSSLASCEFSEESLENEKNIPVVKKGFDEISYSEEVW